MLLLNSLIIGLLSAIGSCQSDLSFSKYRKTNIIINTCEKSWFLQTVKARNIFQCGLRCNSDMNCRRFLFRKTRSECKLYGDGNDCVVKDDAASYRCYKKLLGCNGVNCTCPLGLYGNDCEHIVSDCNDAVSKGMTAPKNVLVRIKPFSSPEAFDVNCWLNTSPAMVILERFGKCSVENFNRTLQEYERGFGMVPWNSWSGLENIRHILQNPYTFSLIVRLVYNESKKCSTVYRNFTIADSSAHYQFDSADHYSSNHKATCGDSMIGSNNTLDLRGRPFSTYDKDATSSHCAARLGGGWWFADDPNCTDSLLTATDFHDNFWNDEFSRSNMKRFIVKLQADI